MTRKYYLPQSANKRAGWLTNFLGKLNSTYAAVFGITTAQMNLLNSMVAYYIALINQLDSLNATLKAWTTHKNEFCNGRKGAAMTAYPNFIINMPAAPSQGGLWAHVRALIKMIKAHPSYDEAIGIGLGIVGPVPTFDKKTFQPVISLHSIRPGSVKLNYIKDQTEGMNFYCSTNGGEWQKRDFDAQPPYEDRTPLAVHGVPEKRLYRCLAVIADVEIGQYSNELEVIVGS